MSLSVPGIALTWEKDFQKKKKETWGKNLFLRFSVRWGFLKKSRLEWQYILSVCITCFTFLFYNIDPLLAGFWSE